jgi:hypothetical protein
MFVNCKMSRLPSKVYSRYLDLVLTGQVVGDVLTYLMVAELHSVAVGLMLLQHLLITFIRVFILFCVSYIMYMSSEVYG